MNDDMLSPQSLFIEPPRRDRITAISSAVHRRPIVLVLGMHRSGTSLCSHILSALGVDMADRIPGPGAMSPTPDNPRGHWERWEIVEFHDRIFHLFNRDYFGRFHDFALPVAWWAEPRITQIRREIVAFLETRMGDGYFGFKDPRTVRLMPVWHQIFNELKLAPKIVLCLRNPAQVARSLNARDGLDPEIGEYRWLVHMIDFFRYGGNFDYCAVKYEDWFDNPAGNIEKLKKFLDLPWQQSEADLALLLSDVIDPGARHDAPTHQEASQPLVRTLY
ncbi:MAG TPA: sulfotransferase, partial [Stellaceae bacterium]|nr:sulfotransferase [Stellaceae bacterium]